MIQVLVSGALGRMGTEICKAVDGADDMTLAGGVDPAATDDTTIGSNDAPVFASLKTAIEVTRPNVVIDFTRPDVAEANVRCALELGVSCVLGTTAFPRNASERYTTSPPRATPPCSTRPTSRPAPCS